MKKDVFVCGNKLFKTLDAAIQYANKVQAAKGIILGIEKV